ncbi:MAG: caa(3)-type oxidase subunit IV [Hyphomicrobiaceae bacterium]|jgi:caa(3)-type oxidase subunit IV
MSSHDDHAGDIRKYWTIFGALCVLTIVTVALAYIDLSAGVGVGAAMAVALTKGSLVALFFMHLSSEVSTIYRVLALTVSFFIVLMTIPTAWWADDVGQKSIWDQRIPASRMVDDSHGGHDAGHETGGH